MAFGARNSRQTTKISAETFLVNNWSLGTSVGCRALPRGRRFRCLNFTEQLVEDPDEVVVVLTPKHLRDKNPPFDEKFHRELQTHENEL